jgi:methyl-accepting chemotaxis protein
VEDLAGTQISALRIRIALAGLLAQHDPAEVKQTTAHIRELEEKLFAAWTDYYPSRVSDDAERAVADGVASGLSEFRPLVDTALADIDSGNTDGAAAAVNRLVPVSVSLSDALEKDSSMQDAQIKDGNQKSEDLYVLVRCLEWGSFLLSFVVVICAAAYLLKVILGPLRSAVQVAERIAEGKLDNDVTIASNDEFGNMLHALKTMDRQLADVVRGIKDSSESISVAAGEIAAGNTDLSSRTEQQAASLEETAASMEQLTATVRQNAENAHQATSLAASATEIANAGNAVVGRMLTTMGDITTSSATISDITSLIEGIAFQTNILALNAAVEAARAGEQGRGFAVVAGEVRSLAQRASSAAKEIKDLIQHSVETVRIGSEQAGEVGHTMDEVLQAIKRVADINAEISAASEEQRRGIEQVNLAVGQMDEVTQQNAALVEQASAAAQSLDQMAVQQKNAVAVFTLGDRNISQTLAG